jgi:hypothetical protein
LKKKILKIKRKRQVPGLRATNYFVLFDPE